MKFLKLHIFIVALFCYAFCVSSCSNKSSKADNYYKKIYNCTSEIFKYEDTLIGTITAIRELQSKQYFAQKYIPDSNVTINIDRYINNMDKIYNAFLKSIDSAQIALKKLPDFDNDKQLKNKAFELTQTYKNTALNDYQKIIDIIKISPEIYTIEDDTRFQELSDSINVKLEREIDSFNKILEDFFGYYKVNY